MLRRSLCCWLLLSCLCAAVLFGQEAPPRPGPVLRLVPDMAETEPSAPDAASEDSALANGRVITHDSQIIPGDLVSVESDAFRWKSSFLRDPVDYSLTGVWRLTLNDTEGRARTPGTFLVRLTTGDVLTADIQSASADAIVLKTPRFGEVTVPVGFLISLERRPDASVIAGPGGPVNWSGLTKNADKEWKLRSGSFRTDAAGSIMWRNLELSEPRELNLDFEVLGDDPAFRVGLGVMEDLGWLIDGVFIESWGDRVVVYRELEDKLEVQTLSTLPSHGGVRVHILWNPVTLSASITMGSNTVDISIPEDCDDGLILESMGGGMALHDLRCRPSGIEVQSRRTYVWDDIAGFDAETGELVLSDADGSRVPIGNIESIQVQEAPIPGGEETDDSDSLAELFFHDGTRLFGEITALSEGRVVMNTPWSATPIEPEIDGLLELELPRVSGRRRRTARAQLTFGGAKYAGDLTGWDSAASAILWQPQGCATSSALGVDFKGDMLLNEESEFYAGRRAAPHSIYLANGDFVPGRVIGVSGGKVTFKTPFGPASVLDEKEIKAIEIDPNRCREYLYEKEKPPEQQRFFRGAQPRRDPKKVTQKRRDRILSLPRKLKRNPPTHILVAQSGDIVRGRLVEMMPESVRFDTGSRELRLSLDQLIAVIWLHPEPPKKESATSRPAGDAAEDEATADSAAGETTAPGQAKPDGTEPKSDQAAPVEGVKAVEGAKAVVPVEAKPVVDGAVIDGAEVAVAVEVGGAVAIEIGPGVGERVALVMGRHGVVHAPVGTAAGSGETRDASEFAIQVVFNDKAQLSVQPTEIVDGVIRGTTPLGEGFEIDFPSIQSIRIGATEKRRHAYSGWVLKPMTEPFPDE